MDRSADSTAGIQESLTSLNSLHDFRILRETADAEVEEAGLADAWIREL